MKHVVVLLSSLLFLSPAQAFEGSDDERFCYANIMEKAIEEDWFLFPQTVRKYCSCFYEMEKVGLSSDRCARWEYIPVDEFEG